jgi:transposase
MTTKVQVTILKQSAENSNETAPKKDAKKGKKSPKVTTTYLSQSIGIDVSKDKFDCCFMMQKVDKHSVIKATRTFLNNKKGFGELLVWIKKWRILDFSCPVVMEATGVYYESLAYFLEEHSGICTVHVILASAAKNYLKSLGKKSKTDKIDAAGLSLMGIERALKPWVKPSEVYQVLRNLSRERSILIDERTAIKNQIHAQSSSYSPSKDMVKRSKKRIELIDNQINTIEKTMKECIAKDNDLKERFDHVCTIPGIAFVTAATIIAETHGFEMFLNQRQLVSYAGLDVVHNESGTSVHGKSRISKRGNKNIRKALYFPAMTHVKCKGTLSHTFSNVLDRTKIKMKGYVAIQRKMLCLIYTIFKNNVPYDPKINQPLEELLTETIDNNDTVK